MIDVDSDTAAKLLEEHRDHEETQRNELHTSVMAAIQRLESKVDQLLQRVDEVRAREPIIDIGMVDVFMLSIDASSFSVDNCNTAQAEAVSRKRKASTQDE